MDALPPECRMVLERLDYLKRKVWLCPHMEQEERRKIAESLFDLGLHFLPCPRDNK